MATNPMDISANLSGAGALKTGAENTTVNRTYDPTQQFISNYLQQLYASGGAKVSDETTAGINGLIQNPGATGDIAGQQFQQISKPLVDSLQEGYRTEQNSLRDIMRKNGALQSGASAFETRRLIENQGNRTNQVLASNYVPLVNQLNSNVQAGVNAGVHAPQANTSSLAGILSAYGSSPTSTTSSGITAGTALSNGTQSGAPTSYKATDWGAAQMPNTASQANWEAQLAGYPDATSYQKAMDRDYTQAQNY